MAARYAAQRVEAGISPLTVASEMAALHTVFGWAVAEGLVKRNPFAKVKRLTSSERKPPRVQTDEEIARLLGAARGTIFHDIIYTFLRTGHVKNATPEMKGRSRRGAELKNECRPSGPSGPSCLSCPSLLQ